MLKTQQLQDFTQQVRRDILRMVHAVNSGHPGGSLGCADYFTALYFGSCVFFMINLLNKARHPTRYRPPVHFC